MRNRPETFMPVSRRAFLVGSLGAGMMAATSRRSARAEEEVVVIASYGGSYQDNQRKAYFEPFQRDTGIRVIEATGDTVAKIRSMVLSGNTEWDACVCATADFPYLSANNLLEKIDYAQIDPRTVAELDPDGVKPYGVGAVFSSQVIAFSSKAFPSGTNPQSWADVWNVEKFPGPRLFPAASYVVQPVEPGLMAAGVPMDKVYPLDLPRAYAMFSKIRPHVVRWVSSSAAAPQALVDGEAVVAMANASRIADLKKNNAAVDFTWNEGIASVGYFGIPRGAKHYKNAMRFIDYVARAEPQAAMAKLSPFGPVNRRSFDLISEEVKRTLTSYPENKAKQLVQDEESWSSKSPSGLTYYEQNIKMWNEWVIR
jgi:putative spermidine/putrescine transport system substrate-binding protein